MLSSRQQRQCLVLTKGLHGVVIYTNGSKCTCCVLPQFSQEEARYTMGTQEGAKASVWLTGDRREVDIMGEAQSGGVPADPSPH